LKCFQQFRTWVASTLLGDDRAAQLVEFAVALPLLVVFVVGIFDFSSAFTLKQKLTNIARDVARAAASEPATDVTNPGSDAQGIPSSVDDAFQLVQQYLTANNINTCGVVAANAINGPAATWTFSASVSSPPCSITVKINRGYYFPANGTGQIAPSTCLPTAAGPNQLQVVATCVSIQYAYQWRFGTVSSLLGPTMTLPSPLIATAVAMNED
jgi:Flp pilus assembly protein TadG